MGIWIKLLVLYVIQAPVAWTRDCDDPCFCPVEGDARCASMGISQPPPGYWPEIQYLDLEQNNIQVLYKRSLTGFPNIRALFLSDNLLTELDMETFTAMPFLEELFLQRNAITTIFAAPSGQTIGSLSYLFLQSNKISALDPEALSAAIVLKFLFLDENPLTVRDNEPLLNHPTVEVLYLMRSTVQFLGPETLKGLPRIDQISVSDSNITNISGAFVNNPHLYIIILSSNSITEVTAGTFAPTDTLLTLGLDNNPLQRLDVSAVADAVPSAGAIYFSNTPLACSCRYQSLYWWAKGKGVYLDAYCDGQEPCSFVRKYAQQSNLEGFNNSEHKQA